MLLLLKKAEKTKDKNYIKYDFNMIEKENIKEKKIFTEYSANAMNIHRK